MKVMLINLPWFQDGSPGVRAGSRWPHIKNETERDYLPFPFHLAYAAALLEQAGFQVRILDAIAEGISNDTFLKEVKDFEPHVLVSEIAFPSRTHDLALLQHLNPGIKIILCGSDHEATHDLHFIEQHPFIHAAIAGEYEWTLLQLLLCWKENRSSESLYGVIFKNQNKPAVSKGKPFLPDINRFPWPHRKTLPMRKYIDAPGGLPLPSVQMWASRGCPFSCTFCVWPQAMSLEGRYRPRPIEEVLNEMHYLVHHLKFRSIYFDDDTFNVGTKRMEAFCRHLIERRKKREILVPWGIMARADLMSEPLLDLFKEAGLYSVKYGVESADQTILNNINKKMDLEKSLSMIRYTQKLGIKTHLTFMFGLPGETKETIEKTIDLALSLNPDSLQFSEAIPFPGTVFREQIEKPVPLAPLVLDPEIIKKAREEAYRRWGEHCLLRRTPQKIRLNLWHWRRFQNFFRQYGWKSAIIKTGDYLRFWLHHNLAIDRHRYQTIALAPNRLMVVGNSLRLLNHERELTRGPGFQSSFRLNGIRYDTSLCDVLVNRIQPNEFYIEFNFRTQGLFLKQLWWMHWESPDRLTWRVDWISEEEHNISELKFSCMLTDAYCRWVTPRETGEFPPIEDWLTIPLTSPSLFSIGVENHKEYPPLTLSYFSIPALFREQIQNTSRAECGRMIHAVSLENKPVSRGRSTAFSGFVQLGKNVER
jgi:radical SAM superfamily enzyme YgiQ (UPF0313 family)